MNDFLNYFSCFQNAIKNGTHCEAALRNHLILREIFKHVSTLLSSCSLVINTWNKYVYTFIRTSRMCVASNPDKNSAPNTCQLLQDLKDLCGQIRDQGCEIPFTGLKLELLQSQLNARCRGDSGCDGVSHINLPGDLKQVPKYVEITCSASEDRSQGQDASTFFIRKHTSEIQYLTTHGIPRQDKIIRGDDQLPKFPKLEEIAISGADSYDH